MSVSKRNLRREQNKFVIDFKSVAEYGEILKVYFSALCKMRRGELKIFVFLLFFLDLFKNLNSGRANKANVSEGLLFVLVLKFPFVSQYNLLHTYTQTQSNF